MIDFQFLRPFWLLALPVAWLLVWLFVRSSDPLQDWRKFIAPHLLAHLVFVQKEDQAKNWPIITLILVWSLTALALAGPSWQKEVSPFAEDRAALMILVEVSESMQAEDVQPSRQARAVHKIQDLLSLRADAQTGLIAYAGSAHLVVPLTTDADIIRVFAADLSSEVMPVSGDDALQDALLIAEEELFESKTASSVLVLTDKVSPGLSTQLDSLIVLGVTNNPEFGEALTTSGMQVVRLTDDTSDVVAVNRLIDKRFAERASDTQRRNDGGYWLVPIIALFTLLWFRGGWVVSA